MPNVDSEAGAKDKKLPNETELEDVLEEVSALFRERADGLEWAGREKYHPKNSFGSYKQKVKAKTYYYNLQFLNNLWLTLTRHEQLLKTIPKDIPYAETPDDLFISIKKSEETSDVTPQILKETTSYLNSAFPEFKAALAFEAIFRLLILVFICILIALKLNFSLNFIFAAIFVLLLYAAAEFITILIQISKRDFVSKLWKLF